MRAGRRAGRVVRGDVERAITYIPSHVFVGFISRISKIYPSSRAIEIPLGCQDLELRFARRKGSREWIRRHKDFVRKVSTPIFRGGSCLDIECVIQYNG